MTRSHYAESLAISAGEHGEIILEFVRSDGRKVQGSDRLIVRGENLERLVEGLPLVMRGAVRRVAPRDGREG